jgi:hypothetical protein
MSQIPDYIERVKTARAAAVARGSWDGALEARTPHGAKPVASFSWPSGDHLETNDIDEVCALYRQDSRQTVCVVEDISWDWIGAMGITWEIGPSFFADYGVNPSGDNPWNTLFLSVPEPTAKAYRYHHLDGVFEHQYLTGHPTAFDMLNNGLQRSAYHRRCWIPAGFSHPPSSSTRISYCRVNANFCKHTHLPP